MRVEGSFVKAFVIFGFSINPDYAREFHRVILELINKEGREKLLKEIKEETLFIIASGGARNHQGFTEAEGIRDFLEKEGIPFQWVVLEKRSIDSYSNIRNSLQIIKELQLIKGREPYETLSEVVFIGEAAREKETLEIASRLIFKETKEAVTLKYIPLYLLPEGQRKRREKLGRLLTLPGAGSFIRVLWYIFRIIKINLQKIQVAD